MNTQLVHLSNNRLVTTSLDIAQNFGKKHKNVLQSIQELECSKEFGELNFQPTTYLTAQNKEMPMYEITRDGFVFLCMGFTGAAAAHWKEKYIAAFNAMEQELQKQNQNSWLLEELKDQYLLANPTMNKLFIYYLKGLTLTEMAKLLDISTSTVLRRLKHLAQLEIIQYQPNPTLSQSGKKGNQAMRFVQQSLELGE